jgi:hypothetical protein
MNTLNGAPVDFNSSDYARMNTKTDALRLGEQIKQWIPSRDADVLVDLLVALAIGDMTVLEDT